MRSLILFLSQNYLIKKVLLATVLVVTTLSAFSQTGFHAGAHFGFNGVFIHNQNSYGFSEMDYEMKFGVYPGIALGYNFDDMNGIQLELNYAQMGQDYYNKIRDFSLGSGNNDPKVDTYRQIDLNYLQIPIMYRFQTERKKKSNAVFHAMGGPTIGLLLSGEQAWQAYISNNGTITDIPEEIIQAAIPDFSSTPELEADDAYFSTLDFGIQLTVGANIYLNDNLYLSPDLRMYYGFTDINAEATRELYNDFEFSRNAFVGISVGIHYHMEQ
jgi:hypothetical protein